jgi:two-component system response regulator MprA
MRVLVVDGERTRTSLRRALELEGYEVELAPNGDHALDRLSSPRRPDAAILDAGMSDGDGLEVCRRIRRNGNTVPVLLLADRSDAASRVAGLDAGADDCLPKHFGLSELLARIHALVRRAALRDGGEASGVLRFVDLELIPAAREARRGGWSIDLTGTEFDLLELFIRNPRRVLTRERIFDEVWGYDLRFASNSLNVYVGYLRRKTEVGGRPRLIHTVRGVGYVLREA